MVVAVTASTVTLGTLGGTGKGYIDLVERDIIPYLSLSILYLSVTFLTIIL